MKTFAAIVIFLTIGVGAALAQSTAFTYQGFLKDGSTPASGNYTISISLWDAETGGAFINSNTYPTVAIVNGVFTLELDFGESAFSTSAARYVEVAVKPVGGATFTTLTPRTRVRSVPASIQSLNSAKLGGVGAASYVLTTDPRLSDPRDPQPNSPDYIRNSGSVQANSNFSISGNGTAGGNLSASQFNIGSNRFIAADQYNNLAIGIDAGVTANDTAIFNNSYVGFRAGKNSNGLANSFFGAFAGEQTIAGSKNSFFGVGAGISNIGGNDNSLFGFDAGRNRNGLTATGSRNTIIGTEAGVSGIGSDNTYIGYRAGYFPDLERAGSFNTAIGADSGVNYLNNLQYATAIGAGTRVSASNTIQLGRQGGADMIYIPGGMTLDTIGSGGSISLCLNFSTNIVSSCSSSARYKDNINTFTSGLDLIRKLRPVSFNWKDSGMADMGLVAEEVAEVELLLTSTNAKGEVEGVKYDRVGVVLVNAVKEQQAQIEAQQKQIEQQQLEIEQLKKKVAEVDELKAYICGLKPDAQICKKQD
ncbi:MAG: tail fiber domain-containing protein [Pyrinomonadaceae bacterium]|nr:tail fiber domain-containing protein [Pyrinomonadaceae bacterium]MBP6211413.1 tail fiber domain-containing protein [Pyrinomonadaceae bacterium]